MTLDQAIKYEEDTIRVNTAIINNANNISISDMELSRCRRIMEESKQIAEWLTDYKRLLKSTNWIPVSERLPEEDTAVLIWCPERRNIYCGYLEEKQWWIFGAYFQKVPLEVIAWMPLPLPWKGE